LLRLRAIHLAAFQFLRPSITGYDLALCHGPILYFFDSPSVGPSYCLLYCEGEPFYTRNGVTIGPVLLNNYFYSCSSHFPSFLAFLVTPSVYCKGGCLEIFVDRGDVDEIVDKKSSEEVSEMVVRAFWVGLVAAERKKAERPSWRALDMIP